MYHGNTPDMETQAEKQHASYVTHDVPAKKKSNKRDKGLQDTANILQGKQKSRQNHQKGQADEGEY